LPIAHVGGRYANFEYWGDDVAGLVEIHSHHGTFEWFAEDAIRRGLVVGFVGQSDDHTGRPGLSAPLRALARDFATFDVYGGYTGIFSDNLSRQSVWDALKARHCYATTGKRIFLDVRTPDNAMMGDIVEGERSAELAVSIAGTAPLLDIEIRRNTEVVYRHPFKRYPDDTWVRVEWSGVRVKSRAKTADWDGVIRITGGEIEDFRPYAFDQKEQGVSRLSDSELGVVSTTSGDIDGVFLKVSGDNPVVAYEKPGFSCEAPVESLDEELTCFDAGGVNLRMHFSLCSPFQRPSSTTISFRDENPCTGMRTYWVKVVQVDGHMAWSSPVYFT